MLHGRLRVSSRSMTGLRSCVETLVMARLEIALFCCAAFAAYAEDLSGRDTTRGRAIAVAICSACHVVAADQAYPPILRRPGPSFQTIAEKPTATGDTLRRFISTTHTTVGEPFKMPNPELTDEMQEQVVTYILSLRNRS